MKSYEKEPYIELLRYLRRNRSILYTTRFHAYTAEHISRYLIAQLGYREVQEITDQLLIIEKRKGSTGNYLITLFEAALPE
jgi:hypothetical protein